MRRLLAATGSDGTIPGYSAAQPPASRYGLTVTAQPGDDLNALVTAAGEGRVAGTRSRVILQPGDYADQRIATVDGVDLVGATAAPADVVVHAAGGVAPLFSPINTQAAQLLGIYVAGITFRLDAGAGSGQYAMHMHAAGLQVFERCLFASLSPDRPTAVGADMDAGSLTYFLGCTFVPLEGAASNFHGTDTNATALRLVISGATSTGTLIYDSLGSGQDDEVWIVGGDVPAVTLAGAAAHGRVDPAFPVTLLRSATYEASSTPAPSPIAMRAP